MNCLSSLFQQSVRLISLCNRLSRSFLSRSNISVARSDDTLVSYKGFVPLGIHHNGDYEGIKTQDGAKLILIINLCLLLQSSSLIYMWCWTGYRHFDEFQTVSLFIPHGLTLPLSALVFFFLLFFFFCWTVENLEPFSKKVDLQWFHTVSCSCWHSSGSFHSFW